MTPYRTRIAKRNLREGIKKMRETMSPAAQVRRQFRLGRPPKRTDDLLRPLLAVDKAELLLADFRKRMQSAGLNPEHVDALIIGVRASNLDEPVFISIDRDKAIAALSAPDIGALGCIFRQRDGEQNVDFFVQFTGLSERGLNVLKRAATMQHAWSKLKVTAN
jgi:hypothetical protein